MVTFQIAVFLLSVITNASGSFVQSKFEFREVVRANRIYKPLKNYCALRIVGGHECDIKHVPYQVSFRIRQKRGYTWRSFCGGAIVTPKHVLSAAHCFDRNTKATQLEMVHIAAGTNFSDYNVNYDADRWPREVWRSIAECYIHEFYKKRHHHNDIAVLVVKIPWTFSIRVQPIPILKHDLTLDPLTEANYSKPLMAVVSGYGKIETNEPSPVLLVVCIPFVERAKCAEYYYAYRKYSLINSQICAGVLKKDSCGGDSGGPLAYNGVLVGLVSYGGACGGGPAVYTLVSSYTTGAHVPFVKLIGGKNKMDIDFFIVFVVLLNFVWGLNEGFLYKCFYSNLCESSLAWR